MRTFCEERAQVRQMLPWYQWMEYNFPCDLEPCSIVAQSGKSRSVKKILVNVKFEGSEVSVVIFYMGVIFICNCLMLQFNLWIIQYFSIILFSFFRFVLIM